MQNHRVKIRRIAADTEAVPASLGQNLRNLAHGFGHGKNLLGRNFAYGVIQSLKECLYFLLCCWCIKEILD
ncbi:lens epithelial cell protein LEP503 [Tachysurus ichikawai]